MEFKALRLAGCLAMTAAVLVGCGDDSGVSEDAGADAAACIDGETDPNEPDLVDAPIIEPTQVAVGANLTVTVPVDGDTGYVSVLLFSVDRTGVIGGADRVTDGDEDVVVSIQTSDAASPGQAFAIINVCGSRDACLTAMEGVAYAPQGTPVTGGRLQRVPYRGADELPGLETCWDAQLVTLN